ncbi:MAG TPA: hypothetical protein VHM92_05555 [Allosphingosinicella sp.]|nr:hypothetical protein [Allosphingosinicella sp.]
MRIIFPCLLMLAACGGDGGNSLASGTDVAAGAAASTACTILTEADAEKALGHKVTRLPATGGPAGLDICQYGWEGERIAETGNVSVTVHPNPISDFRKSVAEAGMGVETVSGVGDDAFWAKEAGLYVGKSNRTAIYLIGGAGISDNRAAAVELARETARRL